MEIAILACFCLCLTACVFSGKSILYALVFGLLLFLVYGKRKGFSWPQLIRMALSGVRTVWKILFIFLLIGALTAVWRAGGTIPLIVCTAAKLIRPSIFYLVVFLLNCVVSVLMGTSFGTSATMGVVCMTMAGAVRLDPVLTGGAVLSGVYFGDRWSPVSTSALLISQLTGTDLFANLKKMFRTALLPFLLACAVYAILGLSIHSAAAPTEIEAAFARQFSLHWFVLLPVGVILLFSAFRVPVKWTMLASILLAAVCCVAIQGIPFLSVCRMMVFGYQTNDIELAPMLNGGGIISMAKGFAIICVSSAYAEIFRKTGLLDGAKHLLFRISRRSTVYTAVLSSAIVSNIVGCSQTFSIMLTHQICEELEPDQQTLAVDLEDTSVIIAPLVPWSLASAVPLASIAAPTASILAACFLYFLPLTRLVWSFLLKKTAPAPCH
ncbi:MAG: sodium:proton antiporter [Oscillibacter sp.]|nr:sodium:proton antiporter [Oscillibacter sp.]